MDRRRLAAHECGHAVMASLLDRVVLMVSLDGPPVGGGVSIDRAPREPLNHRRRPLAHWHEIEDEVVVCAAGALSEDLEYDEPPLPLTPQRVPDDSTVVEPGPARLPLPVAWQEADEPAPFPFVPQNDDDQIRTLTAGITHSEEEREALERALRLRAQAIVTSQHYRALHGHLADVLEDRGELHAAEVRRELQRAEIRYLTNAIPEDSNGSQAA